MALSRRVRFFLLEATTFGPDKAPHSGCLLVGKSNHVGYSDMREKACDTILQSLVAISADDSICRHRDRAGEEDHHS